MGWLGLWLGLSLGLWAWALPLASCFRSRLLSGPWVGLSSLFLSSALFSFSPTRMDATGKRKLIQLETTYTMYQDAHTGKPYYVNEATQEST